MLESVCLAVLLFTYLLRFSARRHCDCKQATHLSKSNHSGHQLA